MEREVKRWRGQKKEHTAGMQNKIKYKNEISVRRGGSVLYMKGEERLNECESWIFGVVARGMGDKVQYSSTRFGYSTVMLYVCMYVCT